MASRSRLTLADYMVQALSPALIMALTGSLVFFLLEIVYQGSYPSKLRWILFFFIFAAVLIGRISMRGDIADRAWLYTIALGLAVWFALQRFVEYATGEWNWAINLFLIALIQWCAQKLTWDCTHVDEHTGSTGEGVLQAAGIQQRPAEDQDETEEKNEKLNWWERYQKHRDEQRKKRTPGVWVIYFSLAALPIFGLGQSLIPLEDADRRQYVLMLAMIYVASGLALLMTTTFLGLRNYLRLRRVRMPKAMTTAWLSGGATIILALVFVGIFLPRPTASTPIWQGVAASSDDPDATNWHKGEGEAGKNGEKDAQGKGHRKDEKGIDNKDQGHGGEKDTKDGQRGKDAQKDKAGEEKDANRKDGKGKRQGQGNNKGGRKNESSQENQASQHSPQQSKGWQKLGQILKWVVFSLLLIFVLFYLIRNGLNFLANFTDWAKNLLDALRRFWESLFGSSESRSKPSKDTEWQEEHSSVPFTAFSNPFLDGRDGQMNRHELVRYTYAAFQAWAREQGLDRDKGETPSEHAARLGDEFPAIENAARKLATLYAWSAYGEGSLPKSTLEFLEKFWQRLAQVRNRPLSA